MSPTKSIQGIVVENQEEKCPFLGLTKDSQTSLSYPSSWNVCHHSKPVASPNIDSQQSFCFSENHLNCPVYNRIGRWPLPSSMRFPVSKPPVQKRVILYVLIGGVVVGLGLIGTLRGIQDRDKHAGSLPAKTLISIPSVTRVSLATDPVPSTDTPESPTLTATPTQPSTNTPTNLSSRPTDTLWPSRTPTRTPTFTPTRPPTILPSATSTFRPTWTPRPTDTRWTVLPPGVTG